MKDLEKAIKILKNGGIVIFPTDTAFGVGCRIDDEKAVKRLFEIRKRPSNKAAPVLVNSIKMAEEYLLAVPDEVRGLMDKYWPGALTIVFPCKKNLVPALVRGYKNNLGVRMPNHKIALSLINGLELPILGPSANFHGEPTPYKYEDLDKNFVKLVDFVLKGECQKKQVSTVIDCSSLPWQIIRQGAVNI